MKTPFITVLLSIVIVATVHAQDDFIVKKSGEKLTGEVYQPLNLLREVQFRANKGEKYQTYAAGDLKGYQFKQHYYATCEIQAEGGNVFLLTLVNGAANLYGVPAKDAFYVEKNGAYHLLEKKNRMVDGREMEDRRFMGTLKALFADCALPEKLFEQLKFSAESLSNATQQYNTCRDPKVVYTKVKKTITHLKLGMAGVVVFNKTEPNENYSGFISNNYGISTGYTAAVDITISHSFASGLFLRLGVAVAKKHGGFSESFSQDVATNSYNLSFLQLPLRLGYALDGKKIAPFLSMGYVFGLPLEKEHIYERRYISSGTVIISEKAELSKTKENGFTGEAGLEIKTKGRMRPFIVYQFESSKGAFNLGYGKFTTHKAMLGIRF